MTNQQKLNELFANETDVDVKFYVRDASEGTEFLCQEALSIFDMHENDQLLPSSVMTESRGSIQSA